MTCIKEVILIWASPQWIVSKLSSLINWDTHIIFVSICLILYICVAIHFVCSIKMWGITMLIVIYKWKHNNRNEYLRQIKITHFKGKVKLRNLLYFILLCLGACVKICKNNRKHFNFLTDFASYLNFFNHHSVWQF